MHLSRSGTSLRRGHGSWSRNSGEILLKNIRVVVVRTSTMAAARLGIEPRLEGSESSVLPLDDLAMRLTVP